MKAPTRILILLLALAVFSAGCGDAVSSIRYVNRPTGTDRIETTQAAWQYTDGGHREIVILRQLTMPAGEAVPDIEYIYALIPDQPGQYAAAAAEIIIYRLTRQNHHEALYRAADGHISIGHEKQQRISATIDANFVPMAAAARAHPADIALPGDDPARQPTAAPEPPQTPQALRIEKTIRIDHDPHLIQTLILRHHRHVRALREQADQ